MYLLTYSLPVHEATGTYRFRLQWPPTPGGRLRVNFLNDEVLIEAMRHEESSCLKVNGVHQARGDYEVRGYGTKQGKEKSRNRLFPLESTFC